MLMQHFSLVLSKKWIHSQKYLVQQSFGSSTGGSRSLCLARAKSITDRGVCWNHRGRSEILLGTGWSWTREKQCVYPGCVERCFLWHGIQHPRGSLPHCELGQEQRPWGSGSPDMRGTPPTSSLGLRLLPWTKPAKESSLTEARAQQQCRGFGRNAANCSQGRATWRAVDRYGHQSFHHKFKCSILITHFTS